ncbi:MAG: 30S ribosomal protein S17 [Acidilobaceae archaeon]
MPAPKPVKNLKIPGVTPPETTCQDKNCPWHGTLRIRGVILEAVVEKVRAQRTAVVVHEYLHYDSKYKRYEKRRRKIHVHKPDCIRVSSGDVVVIGECRPISKTVRFSIVGVVRRAGESSG